MIGTIRKHSTWLWMIIIVVVIISFVFWGSQSSRTDGRRVRTNLGTIDGETVTQESFGKAQREVYLRYYLHTGEWPDTDAKRTGFDPERETYYRLFLIHKQDQLGIHVSKTSESAAEIARIEGRDADAMRLYEQAIRSAREHGFVQNEGLAHEVAARFYAARGFETIAHAYLRNARYSYLRWGAVGKVRHL